MIDSALNRLVISVFRTSDCAVCVRIDGDVDVADLCVFTTALALLDRLRCANVYVDLAGITFAGSALLGFLVRVINSAPPDATVRLCRPSRVIRRLIELSFLDTIAVLCDDVPASLDVGPVR